jgi:hypothetical protein
MDQFESFETKRFVQRLLGKVGQGAGWLVGRDSVHVTGQGRQRSANKCVGLIGLGLHRT